MNQELLRVTMSLLDGFGMTLKIFSLTLLFALPLGLLMSFGSMSKFKLIRYPMKVFVWIIRGTPLMLQLITIFFVPGFIGRWASGLGVSNPIIDFLADFSVPERFTAVMVAFIINYACYFSEIYRGGIESMPVGQYEAGQVLGMTKTQIFFKVILFQVIKKIFPPMGNEIITLVKDTSLARVISVYEIIWAAQKFAKSDGLVWPIFYTAVFYLVFCGFLTLLFGWIEKKMNYYKG
ncbi:MAG: amino acid ABC transporter permease [Clostridia bacterium]|nr:amino acid ABC transporter permease [Clostridia bacterium]